MTTRHDETRLSLGAYALGTLEPADQALVEAHLASCPACLAELTELESVVPVLAGLSADDVARPAPAPDLFARIVSAVDADSAASASPTVGDATSGPIAARHLTSTSDERSAVRRPRARRWLVAVAASVVLLAGAGAAIGVAVSSSGSGTTVVSATSGRVHLRVSATDLDSRTRLQLTVDGLRKGEHCHLVAVADDGTRHDAGRWNAGYDGEAHVTEATDVPRSQLRQLVLYGTGGTHLVTVPV